MATGFVERGEGASSDWLRPFDSTNGLCDLCRNSCLEHDWLILLSLSASILWFRLLSRNLKSVWNCTVALVFSRLLFIEVANRCCYYALQFLDEIRLSVWVSLRLEKLSFFIRLFGAFDPIVFWKFLEATLTGLIEFALAFDISALLLFEFDETERSCTDELFAIKFLLWGTECSACVDLHLVQSTD